jgi:hypothetical protein
MQSSSKQTPYPYFIIIGILILLQIIFFSLENEIWQILLLIASVALILYLGFYIFFFYIQADASFSTTRILANRTIESIFTRRNAFLSAKNGTVDQDYFLLNTKPRRAALYIHPESAVVVTNSKGDLRALGSGFHTLRSGEQLSTSFPLSIQTLICGPEKGENPFSKRKSGENYTSFHARQLRAHMVRSLTADHQEIYPGFTIRYCLRPRDDAEDRSLLEIAQFLSRRDFSGAATSELDILLRKQVSAYWAARVQQAPLSALLSDVDGNSFYHILRDLNALLNLADPSMKLSVASRAANSHLIEIVRLKIPFIRVYLNRVWYMDENHTAQEETARAA